MNWFIAKISFQIITSNESGSGQFEEQLRLLNAATMAEAYRKALEIGRQEEESFLNMHSRPVLWKFTGITDLKEINDLKDGAEIFSTILETENSADYLQIAAQRHQMVAERCSRENLYAIAG
jgi:hypothetical protein